MFAPRDHLILVVAFLNAATAQGQLVSNSFNKGREGRQIYDYTVRSFRTDSQKAVPSGPSKVPRPSVP